MSNIDKFFYQHAAQELAQGRLDQALWIKVRADNPHSDDKAAQALYVQARAAELASEHGRDALKRIGNTAVTRTSRAIRDTRDAIFDMIRWVLKWSLIVVPVLGLLFALGVHSDDQRYYQTLAVQIETIDQAAAQNNLSGYEQALKNATDNCNELTALSTNPLYFFSDQSKATAVKERCDRLAYIVMDFNNHLTEFNQGQGQGNLLFQLKTIEKL